MLCNVQLHPTSVASACALCLLMRAQCRDLVRGLAPAAVQWLRLNADPETMCGSISVCGAVPHVTNPFKVSYSPLAALH